MKKKRQYQMKKKQIRSLFWLALQLFSKLLKADCETPEFIFFHALLLISWNCSIAKPCATA